jgi:hypothetical protein
VSVEHARSVQNGLTSTLHALQVWLTQVPDKHYSLFEQEPEGQYYPSTLLLQVTHNPLVHV